MFPSSPDRPTYGEPLGGARPCPGPWRPGPARPGAARPVFGTPVAPIYYSAGAVAYMPHLPPGMSVPKVAAVPSRVVRHGPTSAFSAATAAAAGARPGPAREETQTPETQPSETSEDTRQSETSSQRRVESPNTENTGPSSPSQLEEPAELRPVPQMFSLCTRPAPAGSMAVGPDPEPAEEVPGAAPDTKAARLRDQSALAILFEAFVAEKDDSHLQRGIEADVTMVELMAGKGPEDKGEAEWPVWTDTWNDDATRGGAVAFIPKSAGANSPCIFFVHGGGFEWGGPREDGYDSLCSRLASGSGQIVVCCDHPLSGDRRPYKAPEILAALMKGLRWVSRFDPVALERRTAPASLLLAGDSAGANQALSLLLQILSDDSLERELNIRGLALISPWLDLSCGSHTYVSNAFAAEAHTGDVAFRAHADENRAGFKGMGLTYTGSVEFLKDGLYSPYWLARGANSGLLQRLTEGTSKPPPMWICTGAAETLCGETLDFCQQLQGKVPMDLWLHEGMFHDWVMYTTDHPFPSKDAAMQNLMDFLEDVRQGSWTPKGIQYHIDRWK
ncbi:unnamed protein product [Durusdinium trenchii]|uniref:Alpha/beta hydrolase fold-3 domain-containing protein n=2 Tax=Durusdinium trenchii TaxID=1381693 RepID=A0ABP0RLN5_9DINO